MFSTCRFSTKILRWSAQKLLSPGCAPRKKLFFPGSEMADHSICLSCACDKGWWACPDFTNFNPCNIFQVFRARVKFFLHWYSPHDTLIFLCRIYHFIILLWNVYSLRARMQLSIWSLWNLKQRMIQITTHSEWSSLLSPLLVLLFLLTIVWRLLR
jgi:hypothetical protein